jgi:hypothetical protein
MSSHPDIFFGATLKMNEDPFHYCVFISDLNPPDDAILMVRLTGLSEKWEDHCVLSSADYPHLTKPTVPAYRAANFAPAIEFQALVDNRSMNVVPLVSDECLKKIITGARESDEISPKIRNMLPPN